MWQYFFNNDGWAILALLALCCLVLMGAIKLAKSADNHADECLGAIGITLSGIGIVCMLVIGALCIIEYKDQKNKEYTMVVDVYLNPDSPTRKVFKTWQEPIRLEYDESYYSPKPHLRHRGSNVVTISTKKKVLYKINAPVEMVSYTYKVKE